MHQRRLEGFVPALPAGPDRDLQVRAAVASTLLAGLELAREGAVALHQDASFGKVVLAHRQHEITGGRRPGLENAKSRA